LFAVVFFKQYKIQQKTSLMDLELSHKSIKLRFHF